MQYLPLKAQRLRIIAGCQARLDLSSHRLPTLLGSWPSPPCSKRAKSVGMSLTFSVLPASFYSYCLRPLLFLLFPLEGPMNYICPSPWYRILHYIVVCFSHVICTLSSSFKVTCFQALRFGMHISLRSIVPVCHSLQRAWFS